MKRTNFEAIINETKFNITFKRRVYENEYGRMMIKVSNMWFDLGEYKKNPYCKVVII